MAARFCSGLLMIGLAAARSRGGEVVFPGHDWRRVAPESVGIEPQALATIAEIMERAHANGVLVRDGYLVAEWTCGGPADKRFEVQSITKSITGLVLGLALMDRKITSLHAPVKDYYPAFDAGPHTNDITFWHLITASSGIASKRYRENYLDPDNMQPGVDSRYHNDHTAQLAHALTYIYGEPLLDVLRRRVLARIRANADWGSDTMDPTVTLADGRAIRVVGGYAFSAWTARDLARVGWLYLNRGNWAGVQLVPASYAAQCVTPISLPVRPFSRSAGWNQDVSRLRYGLAWRARYSDEGRLLWYMSGNGGQICAIVPEHGIVFTKINGIGKANQPFCGIEDLEEMIFKLVKE